MSSDPILEAQGLSGKLQLFSNVLRIQRKGFSALMLQGVKGDKDIAISQISAVQLKKPGSFANGYIQFSFIGGQESKAGIFDAVKDENTVMFNKKQQLSFEALKDKLDEIRFAKAAPAPASSGLDDLEKLAALRDKGIITPEEFAAKKKAILGI